MKILLKTKVLLKLSQIIWEVSFFGVVLFKKKKKSVMMPLVNIKWARIAFGFHLKWILSTSLSFL